MVIMVATIFAVLPALAETSATKVNIPFAFQVGTTILPAGDYTVSMLSEKAVVLQSNDGQSVAVSLTNGIEKKNAARPHFLFNKYGGQYFLAEAWLKNIDGGRAIFVSAAEREMASRLHKETILLASK
jgi:hypothetical protein